MKHVQLAPRQTRSSRIRIVEVSEKPNEAASEIPQNYPSQMIPAFAYDGDTETDIEFQCVRKRRVHQEEAKESAQIDNSDRTHITNPDHYIVPDPNIEDTDILDTVKVMVLSAVVDSHNMECDEKEREARMKGREEDRRAESLLLEKISLM